MGVTGKCLAGLLSQRFIMLHYQRLHLDEGAASQPRIRSIPGQSIPENRPQRIKAEAVLTCHILQRTLKKRLD